MKESKKAILEILKKNPKKESKFDNLVLNLALQKVGSDSFDFDGDLVLTADRSRLVYCLTDLECVSVPEGVTVIGEMAFKQKKNLREVIIPDTVREIEKDAFFDCDNLDNVVIPASVNTIKAYAFAECDSLKTITFRGSPKHLARNIFSDCDRLHNIMVPAGCAKAFMKAREENSQGEQEGKKGQERKEKGTQGTSHGRNLNQITLLFIKQDGQRREEKGKLCGPRRELDVFQPSHPARR